MRERARAADWLAVALHGSLASRHVGHGSCSRRGLVCDTADATHMPVFHQIELTIDSNEAVEEAVAFARAQAPSAIRLRLNDGFFSEKIILLRLHSYFARC